MDFFKPIIKLISEMKLDEAEEALKPHIGSDSKEAEAWFCLGCLRQNQSKFDDAIKAYNHAFELDEKHARALFNYGMLMRRNKDINIAQKGREAFNRVKDIEPNAAIPAAIYMAFPHYGVSDQHFEESLHQMMNYTRDFPNIDMMQCRCEGSRISSNRNRLAADAMAKQATHVFFIDSVTPDTPILVRRLGDKFIEFKEICEFIPEAERFSRGRKYYHVDYEVLTHKGWQKPKMIMQTKVKKPILRITDDKGTVCVTEAHSLFSKGKEILGKDVVIGTELDHMSLSDAEIPNCTVPPITEEYAEVLGFFAAEGTCGNYKSKKGKNGWQWNICQNDIKILEKYKTILESVHSRRFFFIEGKNKGYKSVWKLSASYPSEIAPHYFKEFYTATKKKRVPRVILNAPLSIVKAFLKGYEKGDGHLTKNGTQCATTNSMTLAAGLHLLYARIGKHFTTDGQRNDKPSIVSMKETKHNGIRYKKKMGVKNIKRDDKYNGWVYDFNTDAGTFVGGVGLFVLHNTDMDFPEDTLVRLLSHDKDIVGATTCKRGDEDGNPIGQAIGNKEGEESREVKSGGELIEMAAMGCCCMLIKIEVFEKIKAPWFYEPPNYEIGDAWGEDITFCKLVREEGYRIWMDFDLSIQLGHWGKKRYHIKPKKS